MGSVFSRLFWGKDHEPIEPLHQAASQDDFYRVKSLLEAGADANAPSAQGLTPLFLCHDTATLGLLIHYGADVNSTDCDGNTPLMKCLKDASQHSIAMLIEEGADVDRPNNNGITPRQYAQTQASPLALEAFDQGLDTVSGWQVAYDAINQKQERARLAWRNEDQPLEEGKSYERVFGACFSACSFSDLEVLKAHEWFIQDNINTIKISDNRANVSDNRTLLITACQDSSAEIVQYLIDLGADVNIEDSTGQTAMRYAAISWKDPVEKIEILASAGGEIDHFSNDGSTPLSDAAFKENRESVRKLISMGADVNHVDDRGFTALRWACSGPKEPEADVVEALLRAGADPEDIFRANCLIMISDAGTISSPENITEELLYSHRMIPIRPKMSGPFKRQLAENRFLRALDDLPDDGDFMVSLGEQVALGQSGTLGLRVKEMINGIPIVTDAIAGYDAYLIDCLLQGRRADKGRYLTDIAYRFFNFCITSDTDANDPDGCSSFLYEYMLNYLLVFSLLTNDEPLLEGALLNGANPNKKIDYRGTVHVPIIAAARSGNISMCARLIEGGADTNMAQDNSETALANATMLGDQRMVKLLLDSGANPNAITHVGTALCIAPNSRIVKLLLEGGADPNIPDLDGDMPIIARIDNGDLESIRMLIEAGTDVFAKNKWGASALDRGMQSSSGSVRSIFRAIS